MNSTRQQDRSFRPTRWSVVLKAACESGSEGEEALATLCRIYWFPLYAFARRQGYSPHDAEDLTQGFFARLLARNYLAKITREGGRFRSFLLTAFKRFLANEWDRSRAAKRGGGQTIVSLDRDSAESRYNLEPAHELTPEKLYDRQWAEALLDRVLTRLREEYRAANKSDLFDQISGALSRSRAETPYKEIAARLQSTEAAIKMAVQRLRARYRLILRSEVARTVNSGQEVEEEIRHLFNTFGS